MLGAITLADAQTTQTDQGGAPITGGTVTLVPLNKQGAGGSAVLTQQGSGVSISVPRPERIEQHFGGDLSRLMRQQRKTANQGSGTKSPGTFQWFLKNRHSKYDGWTARFT